MGYGRKTAELEELDSQKKNGRMPVDILEIILNSLSVSQQELGCSFQPPTQKKFDR